MTIKNIFYLTKSSHLILLTLNTKIASSHGCFLISAAQHHMETVITYAINNSRRSHFMFVYFVAG